MIRVGIGGWIFEPWRGAFFPKGLPKTRELHHASRAVTTIEINSTYYSAQKPETFRKWAEQTPDDFVFAVKASRFATNRRVLAEAGLSVERFVTQGITELKKKLGPILWQFAPTKKFDAEDFEAFLKLLPKEHDGFKLRHAVELRHETFGCAEFMALAQEIRRGNRRGRFREISHVRRRDGRFRLCAPAGCAGQNRDGLCAQRHRQMGEARGRLVGRPRRGRLPRCGAAATKKKRDVFVYMINGAKERAPAAAQALLCQART